MTRRPTIFAALAALLALTACDRLRPVAGEPGGTFEVPIGDPTGGDGGATGNVTVSNCTACHGTPGLDNSSADPLVAAAPPHALLGNDASPAVGAHRAHLMDGPYRKAVECASCHLVPTTSPPHGPQQQGKVTFSRLATKAWTGPRVAPVWDGTTCGSTYCHGNFRNGRGVNPIRWSGAAAQGCGSCHGIPPGGTHEQDPVGGPPLQCGGCHPGYTRTTVNLSLHMNGVVDGGGNHPPGWREPDQHGLVAIAGGLSACTTCHTGFGSPSGSASASCDGCHASPSLYGPYATGTYPDHPSWQTECTFCHGGRGNATGAPPRNTHIVSSDPTTQPTTDATIGAHASHVGAAHGIAAPLDCTACHATRWTSATDPGHMDKATADVFFNPVGAAADPGSYTRPACSATYCHGNFSGGAGSAAIQWTGAFGGAFTLSCTSCHGFPPGPTSATIHHPPNPSCGSCHAGYGAGVNAATHVDGTVNHAPATGCTQCHGDLSASGVASTDVRAAPGSNANAVDAHGNSAATTSARGVGAHARHLTGTTWRQAPIACGECHAAVPANDTMHANGTPAVAFGALARTAWSGQPAINPVWNGAGGAANLTCSSTYCHGAFKNGSSAAPTWATPSAVFCGSCHGVSATNGPGGTHPSIPAGQNCGSCHGGSYTNALVDPALHMNGALDVANLTCSTCHGDANRVPVASAGTLDALGAPLVKASPPADAVAGGTGAHLAHVNQGDAAAPGPLANALACSSCHAVPTSTGHSNGTVEVAFGGLSTSGGAVPAAYNLATHTCASTYCHGNFTGGAGANAIVWTAAGKLGCTGCHGNPPPASAGHPQNDACDACHGAGYTKTGATTGTVNVATHVDGTVNLVSAETCTSCHGTAGRASVTGADANQAAAPPVDSHGQAASVAVGAHLAHSNQARPTPLSPPIACAVCHPMPAQNRHANGTTQVTFTGVAVTGGIANASYAAPNCSATYCHGNFAGGAGSAAAPAWNATGAQLACTACHGSPPGPTSATIHHPPNPSCASCHAGYTATTVNAATHVNGTIQHTPATGCTQCHGDLTASGVANIDVRAAPASNGSAVDAHGNAATATSARGIGAHAKHLTGTTWRSTPIACGECHAAVGPNDATHANGTPAVAFGALASTAWAGQPAITPVWNGAGGAATLTCSSTYCHGAFKNGQNGTPTWAAPSVVACGSCHLVSTVNGPGGTHPNLSAGQTCGSCHGGSYTNSLVDPALHMNGVVDGGGESGGGSACAGCHATIFAGMNGGVPHATKHTLGAVAGTNDSPTDSGITWGNPLSGNAAAARSCVNMCHGDHPHDLTSPATATHESNAYADAGTSATRADGAASRIGVGGTGGSVNRMKTDYDGTQANGGLCASCHKNPVNANHPAIGKAAFDASAHDYTSNTVGANTYAWSYQLHDGGLFARDCTKCHASKAEGTTPQVSANGSATFAVHFSDNASLLSGKTNPGGTATDFVCYNCHGSAAAPGAGAQGNRSGKDIQSQIAHATTAGQSGHPAIADAVHDSVGEFTNATFGNALGAPAAGQRHASCLDCHDPHQAKSGTHTQGTNLAGPPLQGAWGAKWTGTLAAWGTPTSANFTKTTITAGTDLEATLCFKCHSAYYGTLPTSPSSSPAFGETDQAREFNPANPSFHPVLASASANQGATSNVINGWTRTSLMTCTDCHESDVTTDPNGPHGSAARFILKGPNTTWSTTVTNTSSGMPAGTFCANCHAASFTNSRFPGHTNGRHNIACVGCHVVIPHGSGHMGMLVSVSSGGTPAGGVQPTDSAPYASGVRLGIGSYPAAASNWSNSNCGCGSVATGH